KRAHHRVALRAARHADRDPGRGGDRRVSGTRCDHQGEVIMSRLASCPHCADTAPTRRAVITGLAAAAALPATASLAAASAEEDERFMRIAIAEASRADFPFGAVIVRDGKLLVRGRNLGRRLDDPTAHGEMVAIRRALRA